MSTSPKRIASINDARIRRATRTTVDTIRLTPDLVRGWILPEFQRPLRVNTKVLALVEQLKADGGVVPGVMTLGILNAKVYIIDGQHRREAFLLSELVEGFADTRTCHFDDMAEMGEEFIRLNSSLVRLRPDDILRGLEASTQGLQILRKRCPFVGYDNVRRGGTSSPILGASLSIRAWFNSAPEVPTHGSGSSGGSREIGRVFVEDEANRMAEFLSLCMQAWGRAPEYGRLWSALNLTLCMWLYRRTVIGQYAPATTKLTASMFQKCLMALSADGQYLDYLVGRTLNERDRSPCYARIKEIIGRRVMAETGGPRPRLPQPSWASSSRGKGQGR